MRVQIKNDSAIFLYLAVFFISLDSYFRLRGVVGIGFILIYLLTIKFDTYFHKRNLLPVFLMISGFVIYTLLAFLFPSLYLQIPSDRQDFYFKIFDRLSLIILFVLICFTFHRIKYELILKNVALFHIYYLLTQFVLYYGIGIELDILSYFGVEQRTDMNYNQFTTIFRPAGLYWEPSNFSAYILLLYLPYLLKNKKYTKVDYLLPLSIVLTLSSISFAIGVLTLIVMLIKSNVIKNFRVALLALMVSIPLILFAYDSQKQRFEGGLNENVNTMLRINLIDYALKSRIDNPILLIGGVGLYTVDKYIYDEIESPVGRTIASVQDATFFIFTFVITGVIGLSVLFALIYMVDGWLNRFFVLIFMISKISFVFPIFMFFIYMVFNQREIKK
ncbi:hypothetical protein ACNAUY_13500 [Acinetobacter tibetensis]|uniref:hypothetical protein n=1 Tax=Acinetobacter tibetensis TaxID=2943497 RepID=UPI003A4D2C33